jgi:hypothetical protein
MHLNRPPFFFNDPHSYSLLLSGNTVFSLISYLCAFMFTYLHTLSLVLNSTLSPFPLHLLGLTRHIQPYIPHPHLLQSRSLSSSHMPLMLLLHRRTLYQQFSIHHLHSIPRYLPSVPVFFLHHSHLIFSNTHPSHSYSVTMGHWLDLHSLFITFSLTYYRHAQRLVPFHPFPHDFHFAFSFPLLQSSSIFSPRIIPQACPSSASLPQCTRLQPLPSSLPFPTTRRPNSSPWLPFITSYTSGHLALHHFAVWAALPFTIPLSGLYCPSLFLYPGNIALPYSSIRAILLFPIPLSGQVQKWCKVFQAILFHIFLG